MCFQILRDNALELFPSLEKRLKADTYNGAYVDGDTLYVFASIHSLGWYLVVLLDADAILDA